MMDMKVFSKLYEGLLHTDWEILRKLFLLSGLQPFSWQLGVKHLGLYKTPSSCEPLGLAEMLGG